MEENEKIERFYGTARLEDYTRFVDEVTSKDTKSHSFFKENLDISKANKFSDMIFKNVRKKIYKNLKIEKTDISVLNKRVNQLTIDELLWIYNFI